MISLSLSLELLEADCCCLEMHAADSSLSRELHAAVCCGVVVAVVIALLCSRCVLVVLVVLPGVRPQRVVSLHPLPYRSVLLQRWDHHLRFCFATWLQRGVKLSPLSIPSNSLFYPFSSLASIGSTELRIGRRLEPRA